MQIFYKNCEHWVNSLFGNPASSQVDSYRRICGCIASPPDDEFEPVSSLESLDPLDGRERQEVGEGTNYDSDEKNDES